jgi:serine/threonine protein kinase
MTAGLGTFGYEAPELLNAKYGRAQGSLAIDVFAFGVMLWVMLTRRKPWSLPTDRDRDGGHTSRKQKADTPSSTSGSNDSNDKNDKNDNNAAVAVDDKKKKKKAARPMRSFEVANAVMQGQRLPFPADCTPAFRQLVDACWAHDSHDRPTFTEALECLERIQGSGEGMRMRVAPPVAVVQSLYNRNIAAL